MALLPLILRIWKLLLVLSLLSTTYVYLYPLFRGCNFQLSKEGEVASFRLLAFGDPQLEGDSSLSSSTTSKSTEPQGWARFKSIISGKELGTQILSHLHVYRKRLDLWGNDRYLAHIYRTTRWFTSPTHTVVLGDLLGSQWMSDAEFEIRAQRFWNTTFSGARPVPDPLFDYEDIAHENSAQWPSTLITVAGNHDIGYAGELDSNTAARFEKRFGRLNWDITFGLENGRLRTLTRNQAAYAEGPRLKLVVLNTMNLDGPALDKELQGDTRRFLNNHVGNAMGQTYLDATVVLTHIPLYKKEAICVDGPLFTHYSTQDGGGIREQNHLTEKSSREILDGLFYYQNTWARSGIVLNGHDHEGCDVVHTRNLRNALPEGNVSRIGEWTSLPHELVHEGGVSRDESVREVTLRSMMGAYGGNAGLVSGWFDRKDRRWRFEYRSCMFGVQHIWWAVHILDLVAGLVGMVVIPLSIWGSASKAHGRSDRAKKNQ